MGEFDIKPLKPSLHDDVMRFFDFSAYADNPHWASCYDMWPLARSGDEHNSHTKEQNRATRSAVIKSGSLDGKGFARLDGIEQDGSYEVSFLQLDKEAWQPGGGGGETS